VVLTGASIPEDEVRRYIVDELPVLVLFMDRHEYISVLLACRPRVIVLIDADSELLQQSSQLIASLFSDSSPTVLSINVNDARAGSRRLVVHQLGTGATVCIGSLRDITLTRTA
jgi:predicted GTPase